MIKPVLTLALLAGIVTGPAHGASLTFTNSEAPTPISQDGMLDLFDTNIGVLHSVRLTLFGTGTSSFTLVNTSTSSQDVTANSKILMYFSSLLPGLGNTLDGLLPALSLQSSTGLVSLAPGATSIVGPLFSTESLELNALAPTLFSQAGGGSFTLSCESADEKEVVGGNGSVSVGLVTQSGCGATVVYDYTPHRVSEPASLVLAGLGMMGLAAIRRRK